MKNAKRVSSVILAAGILLLSVGCTAIDSLREEYHRIMSGSDLSVSDTDNQSERIDIMLDSLDKGNKEQFRSVFSRTTLRLADDLDKGLDYIFGIYEGQYSETIYSNYSADKHYGEKNTTLVSPIYVIRTTADKYYRIRYSVWTVQEEDPDSVGVYSLDLTECDKDQRGGGGGSWLAGISYPEREGAETVAGGITGTMISGDGERLRSVLSDELLATEDIDRIIAGFVTEYSRINSSTVGDSWMRITEEGIYGYLVANTRPRTFIVYKMSQEQSDKMSSMKVTLVPLDESLPQNDVEPEGVGLFYQKRLK